jgi:hypothetical protein
MLKSLPDRVVVFSISERPLVMEMWTWMAMDPWTAVELVGE